MTLPFALTKISQASVLIPLITGLLFYRRLTKPFKIFVYYFLLAALVEIAASLAGVYLGNNLFLLHFFIPLEFAAFVYLYYQYFSAPTIRKGILYVSILFLGLVIVTIILSGLNTHNSLARSFESIFLIILALSYFYQYFKSNSEVPVYTQPMFWLSSGILIYFSIDFFSFMLINQLIKRNIEMAYLSKMIHVFINIVAYVFYTISFRCFQKMI